MEPTTVRSRMVDRIQHMASYAIIKDRRFLDDEQLIRSEQMTVLEEIFNANVRDAEIQELSSHFAGVLRGDHPCHMAIWGKTGTGKTLTLRYFLNLLSEMAAADHVPLRHEHLDFSTPRPCFRALNDLACLFNASKLYKKGISLEELMLRIEAALTAYKGYLIIFIDEVDNVRRDRDAFLSFLVRRLPQRIPAKLILVFVSNRLNWPDHLDPRVKSFLKLNELIFNHLQHDHRVTELQLQLVDLIPDRSIQGRPAIRIRPPHRGRGVRSHGLAGHGPLHVGPAGSPSPGPAKRRAAGVAGSACPSLR